MLTDPCEQVYHGAMVISKSFSHAKSIVARLTREGYTAYFAGGWVRDYLLGHPSEDIDIATDAPPAVIMSLFSQTVLVGLSFGVVIVMIEDHPFEVATFRKDLPYLDGRHPIGIEMSTPREDALRRDFTINGMFFDPLEEVVHDYVGGKQDLALQIIRTIGDPHERFFEDRLRLVRAFRFAARFSFSIHPETQEAIREHADKLFPAVAMERIWQEFNKMAAYPRFDRALIDMHRLSLLDVIFPELAEMHLNELTQRVQPFSLFPPDCPTVFYFSEVFRFLPLSQRLEMVKRLKVSNLQLKQMTLWDQFDQLIADESVSGQINRQQWVHLFCHADWELYVRALGCRHGRESAERLVERYRAHYHVLFPHVTRLLTHTPVVSSAFLLQHGIRPGKEMGRLLKAAEKLAIEEDLDNPHDILVHLLSSK